MLIDIHTHHEASGDLAFVVGKHSLGIHPWDVISPFNKSALRKKMEELKSQFHSSILGIGECGLDRRHEGIAEISDQEEVVRWHMDWAVEVNRPLILHCVRAHSDLLKLLKEKNYKGKILLHDFAGNAEEVKAYLKFDAYFSFGARLFKKEDVLSVVPLERVFLETDDQTEYSIAAIYAKASEILTTDQKMLEETMMENLKRFFDFNDVSSADVINDLSSRFQP
jgi:TatD DNase family protein